MPQYSLFTHGNALVVETPERLARQVKLGWGTEITFREPVPQSTSFGVVYDEVGPGSWFHLPLTSTLTTFGRRSPRLQSVTLLFETIRCRVTNVHVYDGARMIQAFDNLKLKGTFLESRDSVDIDPGALHQNPRSFANTLKLARPHEVFSAIGISFFACAFFADYQGHNPQFHGPFPPSVLIVGAAGGQFETRDSLLSFDLGKLRLEVEP